MKFNCVAIALKTIKTKKGIEGQEHMRTRRMPMSAHRHAHFTHTFGHYTQQQKHNKRSIYINISCNRFNSTLQYNTMSNPNVPIQTCIRCFYAVCGRDLFVMHCGTKINYSQYACVCEPRPSRCCAYGWLFPQRPSICVCVQSLCVHKATLL